AGSRAARRGGGRPPGGRVRRVAARHDRPRRPSLHPHPAGSRAGAHRGGGRGGRAGRGASRRRGGRTVRASRAATGGVAPLAESPLTGPPAGLPTGQAKVRAVRAMFDAIAPRYDLVNRIMTFGLDVRWRRRAVRELALRPGSLVVDVAAGTGDLSRELAATGHRPLAVDLSRGMLAHARTTAPLVQA